MYLIWKQECKIPAKNFNGCACDEEKKENDRESGQGKAGE